MSVTQLRPLRVLESTGDAANRSEREVETAGVTGEPLEGELLARARAGNMQAWGRLYQAHFDGVYRHLCFLTGESDLAEDLCQETFARAILAVKKFRGDSTVRTWLCRVGLNVAREHWRKAGSRRKLKAELNGLATEVGFSSDVEAMHVDRVRSKVLYAVLATLPDNLREAFILRDLVGVSAEEAGRQLGISAGNVAVRAHRARGRIESELRKRGWLEMGDLG